MRKHAWPLKAGNASTSFLIFCLLPNFKMLPDTLTKIYLCSLKRKNGDKAEPIKKNIHKVYF